MNPVWNDFNLPSALPSRNPPAPLLTPLSQYALVEITGPDAEKFLQGQLSNDVKLEAGSGASYGSYCTPKGRMVASFLMARLDEQTYWLRMRASVVDAFMKTLGKYMVFSKAEQRQVDDYLCLAVSGVGAADLLADVNLPSEPLQLAHSPNITVLTCGENHYETWATVNTARALIEDHPSLLSHASWGDWLSIQAGLGEVCGETIEEFIPQMLNFQLTGAINFKKGCYTGQEVVARMHYRGSSKRRLYRVAFRGNTVEPGTKIFSASQEQEQSVGDVVLSCAFDDGRSEALVVLAKSAVEAGEVALEGGTQLTILELPYAVE